MVAEESETDIGTFQPPRNQIGSGLASALLAENDDQRFLSLHRLAKVSLALPKKRSQFGVAVERKQLGGFGLALKLDGFGVRDIEPCAI